MFIDVFPFKAIIYQLLFLVIAIAIDAFILQRYLGIGRKTSIQYTATANLLSTVVGWFIFFLVEPVLPPNWRQDLIDFIFFDLTQNSPVLIGLAFLTFLGTFVVKLQSLDWLDQILGNKKPVAPEVQETPKFRGRAARQQHFANIPNRALAMLWANAASFSAITLIIAIRMLFATPALVF
jgi:hypothetical protein